MRHRRGDESPSPGVGAFEIGDPYARFFGDRGGQFFHRHSGGFPDQSPGAAQLRCPGLLEIGMTRNGSGLSYGYQPVAEEGFRRHADS